MRTVIAFAACTLAAAGPLWAQPPVSLTGPRTLTPAHVMCTDLPVVTRTASPLFVKGGHNTDGHTSMYRGEVAVLNRAVDDGMRVGQTYFVRRLHSGPTREFPRIGEGFGMVRTAGWLTVTHIDEVNALALINYSCDSIEAGDYLEPYVEVALPTSADAAGAPIFGDYATILFGTDTRTTFGDGDTLNIDRGTVHGVTKGARFAIYRNIKAAPERMDARDRKEYPNMKFDWNINQDLPLVYLGDAVVMEEGELTSKVVLIRVTDVVQRGDVVVRRRNP